MVLTAITVIAEVLTIIASGIAIIVYFKNRKRLASAFGLLINFSFQNSISEIKQKIERLNEYKTTEPADKEEIQNILHEIAGQLRGNAQLSKALPSLLKKIERAANDNDWRETSKRALTSEMRELIRNVEVNLAASSNERKINE